MSTHPSLHQQRIVDNAPTFPDIGNLGRSRVARKLRRKTLDAYYVALRRHQRRPALSGPPIPNSEKKGSRQFYTLEQARRGGRRSGETRRRKAEKKWREVCTLRRRGFGIRHRSRGSSATRRDGSPNWLDGCSGFGQTVY